MRIEGGGCRALTSCHPASCVSLQLGSFHGCIIRPLVCNRAKSCKLRTQGCRRHELISTAAYPGQLTALSEMPAEPGVKVEIRMPRASRIHPHPTLAQSLTSSFSPLTACRNLLAMKSQGVRGEAELEREHMRIPELRDSLGILHVTKSSRSLPRGFAPPSRWIKRCVCPPGSTSPNGKCEQLNPSNTS